MRHVNRIARAVGVSGGLMEAVLPLGFGQMVDWIMPMSATVTPERMVPYNFLG